MGSHSNITILLVLLLFMTNIFSGFGASSSTDDQINGDFVECLTVQLQSTNSATDVIYTSKNTSYPSLLLIQNLRFELTNPNKPLIIFTPFYDHEIRAAIYCSKKLGVQIRVRSGGHDYEGLSSTSHNNSFVIVDMRNLRTVSIADDEKTAWVGVGATLGQLYHTLAQKSRTLAFTAGVCPTVGVGGHFSGGGYGMMSRKHGLAADNVIDAKLMNADGRILNRRSMGEDLFWAIRGGGGTSFGIVLAFKVKVITVPETVTVCNVTITSEPEATELVHRWQYVADKLDDNMSIRLFVTSLKSSATGNRTIAASFQSLYLGGVDDLMPLMEDQFPELGLKKEVCSEVSWIESVLFFAVLPKQSTDVLMSRTYPAAIYFKGKSDYVTEPIPLEGLRGMWRFLHEEAENNAPLQFSPYGGAINSLSESDTPFPHRSGTRFMIEYGVSWDSQGNEEAERHINWMNSLYSYMATYVSKSPRAAYFNYRDLDLGRNSNSGNTSYEEASVWGTRYFKNNFKRLVRVKTKVDPSNFFRNEQSIPPYAAPDSAYSANVIKQRIDLV